MIADGAPRRRAARPHACGGNSVSSRAWGMKLIAGRQDLRLNCVHTRARLLVSFFREMAVSPARGLSWLLSLAPSPEWIPIWSQRNSGPVPRYSPNSMPVNSLECSAGDALPEK